MSATPEVDVSSEIFPLVLQLTNTEQRENALLDLSKKRETFPDLAPILWYSFGTISSLLQEIISIYPMLSPPTLTPNASNRVCNALALLQCVASHPETKARLMQAYIPLYLYPFLNTISRQRAFEYLRLTSLGVIGALVKVDDPEVVHFLLETEIIPLCLRIMETGSELSKTVATFILQKILLDDAGLNYICATSERFYAVSTVLSSMVAKVLENPSNRLLKHIVRCYLRLSEHGRACDALKQCLPESLKDQSFAQVFKAEEAVQRWLALLIKNINDRPQVYNANAIGSDLPQNTSSQGGGQGQSQQNMGGQPRVGQFGTLPPVPSVSNSGGQGQSQGGRIAAPWGV